MIDGEEKYDEDEEPRSTGKTGTYGNFAFAKFISAVGCGLVFCYRPRWINLKLDYLSLVLLYTCSSPWFEHSSPQLEPYYPGLVDLCFL